MTAKSDHVDPSDDGLWSSIASPCVHTTKQSTTRAWYDKINGTSEALQGWYTGYDVFGTEELG